MGDDLFELQLPSLAEHLATARSFAAAVARHYDVAGEVVEDLKIAISEACVDALVARSGIRVRAEDVGRAVTFEVDAPDAPETPEQEALDELGAPARLELIRSLFADATIETDHGRRAVRFSLPID
jgi:anti-sigma regulatory factor (Ser/Thr protein kinase)